MKTVNLVTMAMVVALVGVFTGVAQGDDPYADSWISYTPGGQAEAPHTDPSKALEAPDGVWVSLGDEGELVLRFDDNVVADGPGADLRIVEIGTPERANIYVSANGGASFVLAALVTGSADVDLTGTGLSVVNAVKIVDLGDKKTGPRVGGYDVDAVVALNLRLTVVPVDIKPQSCPNPLNIKSKGVLPVAILGKADFDVATIDPASVALEGVAPLRWAIEDVATPVGTDAGDCGCTTAGPDGFADLTLKFGRQAIVAALGPVSDGDVLTLRLTANLSDGMPIEGTDCVIIRSKGKP
jgi:hypothetical protein